MDTAGFDFNALRTIKNNEKKPFLFPFAQAKPPNVNHVSNNARRPDTKIFNFSIPNRATQAADNDKLDAPAAQPSGFKMFLGPQPTQPIPSQPKIVPPQLQQHILRMQSSPAFEGPEHSQSQPSAVSRSASPMPQPGRPLSRTRSRAPSTPAPQYQDDTAEIDPEEQAFSELMKRKLKGVSAIKVQLNEERLRSANLQYALTAAESATQTLQNRAERLEATSTQHINDHNRTRHELEEVRSQLSTAGANLDQARAAVEDTSRKYLQDKEDTTKAIGELKEELARKSADIEHATRRATESEERVQKLKKAAKKGLEELGGRYDSLLASLNQLKSTHDLSQSDVAHARREMEGLRMTCEEKMTAIQPILDHTGQYFAKGAETRIVLQELQHDRDGARQVIDLLRDKLQDLGGQVVEAKEKITELEEKERERVVALGRREGVLESVGGQFQVLADRLMKKETEEIKLLAEAAQMEHKLGEAQQRVSELDQALCLKTAALGLLTEEIRGLQSAVSANKQKIEQLETSLHETSHKLLKVTEKSARDVSELQLSKEAIKSLEEKKQVLDASLKASSAKVHQLEQELREMQAECATETARKEQATEKVRLLTLEVEKMKAESVESEEELRQLNTRIVVLQERFDSQGMTLKLTKEHSGDLQERLQTAEHDNIKQVEALSSKYEINVAILHEQKASVQVLLHQEQAEVKSLQERLQLAESSLQSTLTHGRAEAKLLQERLKVTESSLQTVLTQGRAESKSLQESLHTTQEKLQRAENSLAKQVESLSKAQIDLAVLREQKASLQSALDQGRADSKVLQKSLEKRAQGAEDQLKENVQVVAELRERLDDGRLELAEARRGASSADAEEGISDEVVFLNEEIKRLEHRIDVMVGREASLQRRYKDGELSDHEKALVSSILQMSQAMHEQEIVAKDNELRRRDNMVTTLQKKIESLESTLAKCLRQKGKESGMQSKPMVDLNLWMSSSPIEPNVEQDLPSNATRTSQTASSSTNPQVSSTTQPWAPAQVRGDTPPVKTFAQLSAENESDSDDDKPISALGKRDRPSSPAKVDDSARPARRPKAATTTRKSDIADKKIPDNLPKTKSRKRRS